jgi:peptide-methionine (S)-S-oxide reductase
VTQALSGYSGGDAKFAHYELVSMGNTGHAESVQITFDPAKISYGTILKVFFSIAHDPTELNYQGPDEGTQYRSAIFYANAWQKNIAQQYIALLTKARVYTDPIVTEVVPLKAFYAAEDYHQRFLDNNPDYPYIVMFDLPKIATLKKTYPNLVADLSAKL